MYCTFSGHLPIHPRKDFFMNYAKGTICLDKMSMLCNTAIALCDIKIVLCDMGAL